MNTLKQPKYGEKAYYAGLNSKGLKSNKDAEPLKSTTERGQRRKAKPAHSHEWVSRKFEKNTSYHDARIQNETWFECSNGTTKPVSGGVVRGGSPHKKGCGCKCKAPKA